MAVYLSFFILLIGFACLTSTSEVHNCKSPRHAARAQEYFDQGNLIWTEGQKPDSIPFYRAAVRLCPESATYWLTLGTAEQFAGDKVKADGRFRKSQQILGQVLDLDDVVVGSNTDSIQTSTSSSAASAEIPTLTLEKVMQSHFSSPFVITNAVPQGITHSNDAISHGGTNTATDSVVDNLDMLNVTQLFTYLHTQYGDEPVEFYPQNMLVKPFRMYKSTIAEALDYLAFPDGAYVSSDVSEAGAYVQLTLSGSIYGDMLRLCGATRLQGVFRSDVRTLLGDEEADDVDVEKFYATTHWYMMLIGETGAGMFNHTDQLPVGSYQLQLTGRKIWTVCLPSSTASSFQTSAPTPTPTCFIYTLQPGEAIYYPPYAHHATQCIEGPCTSISGSVVVDEYSLKRFVYTECNEKRRGYQFSNVICRRMWD